ncbi:MAG: DNA-directed RNA polymerase subunit omega [Pyrinomonadaceae bacterium]
MTDELELEENEEVEEIEDVVVDPDAIPAIDSKYRFILLAAQRAKQIQRGAKPRVELDPVKIKPTTIAREEFRHKKVNFSFIEREKVG